MTIVGGSSSCGFAAAHGLSSRQQEGKSADPGVDMTQRLEHGLDPFHMLFWVGSVGSYDKGTLTWVGSI